MANPSLIERQMHQEKSLNISAYSLSEEIANSISHGNKCTLNYH